MCRQAPDAWSISAFWWTICSMEGGGAYMIVSQIRKLKRAEERLKMAKADLASLSFGCQSHAFNPGGGRGSYSDPTAKTVMKKEMLEARVRSAETCCKQEQEVLSNMLVAIGDETTAKLLLDRYYYELRWEEAAARNGLKVSAAKMRVKRYQDSEGRVA